jgi:hypothetical protein
MSEHTEDAGGAVIEGAIDEIGDAPPAPSGRRSLVLAVVTFLVVIGLVAAGVAITDTGGKTPQALPLQLGSSTEGAPRASGATNMLYPARQITYKLGTTLPDLGSSATVYRLTAPSMDAQRVAELARALGITSAPTQSGETWTATGDKGTLTVSSTSGGWFVTYSQGAVAEPGVVPGSTGSGSSGSSGSSSASTGSGVVSSSDTSSTPVPVPTVTTVPTTVAAPQDLPSKAQAQQIATDLLDKMGVLPTDVKVEVTDGMMSAVAYACAEGVPCPKPPEPVVQSRVVTFRPVVDGMTVDGLAWTVEVGDQGVVVRVDGLITSLDSMGGYSLRSTQDVYDDLVAGKGMIPGPVPLGAEVPVMEKSASAGSSGSISASGSSTTCPELCAPGTDTTVPMTVCPMNVSCTTPAAPASTLPVPTITTVPMTTPTTATTPTTEVQPIVVTITGVTRGLTLVYGTDKDGAPTAYLVPTYHFVGTYEDGGEYSVDLIAIDESLVISPVTTTTVAPSTAVPPSEPGSVETLPATVPPCDPATERCVTTIPPTTIPGSPTTPVTGVVSN